VLPTGDGPPLPGVDGRPPATAGPTPDHTPASGPHPWTTPQAPASGSTCAPILSAYCCASVASSAVNACTADGLPGGRTINASSVDGRACAFRSLRVGERSSRGVNRIGHTAEDSPPAGEWTGAVNAGMSVPTPRLETMTPTRLDLDDVVAVATIVEAMLERPMTPNESSRFKSAYQRGGTLAGFADQIAA